MKKYIAMFVALVVMTVCFNCSFVFASNGEPEVTVFVDGNQIQFDVAPIIENGRTLVPMRYIFEALDAKVEWINEENTAIATKDGNEIKVIIGSNYLWKNGTAIQLDVPAKLVNDRTLVPVRAVSEGLGAKVDWDENLFRVIITSFDETKEISLYDKITTPDENGKYNITQLSTSDFEFLKSTYGNIRYVYEQEILPQLLFTQSSGIFYAVNQKNEGFLSEFAQLWDIIMSDVTTQIQEESVYIYDAGNLLVNEDTIVAVYSDILKCAKLSSDDLFKVSFQTTPGGKNVLLTTFNDVVSNDPTLITSKYLAVIAVDNGIRYFTLEYSPMAKEFDVNAEVYFLCEISPNGRNNYGNCPCTLNDFLNGIDTVVK